MLVTYSKRIQKKEFWFYMLFSLVIVVDTGYFIMSMSQTLNGALWANRIVYLGQVFLLPAMFMINLKECRFTYKKILPIGLSVISIVMYAIVASPGYLDIYYKKVTLEKVNGVSVLVKEYGPLHGLYMWYLLIYFGAMLGTIFYAQKKNKIDTIRETVTLAGATGVNICVWLLEQLIKVDFEFLSVKEAVQNDEGRICEADEIDEINKMLNGLTPTKIKM